MRNMTTAFAAALAVLALAACAKKEEAPAAEAPAVEQAAPVEVAPAEPAAGARGACTGRELRGCGAVGRRQGQAVG